MVQTERPFCSLDVLIDCCFPARLKISVKLEASVFLI